MLGYLAHLAIAESGCLLASSFRALPVEDVPPATLSGVFVPWVLQVLC